MSNAITQLRSSGSFNRSNSRSAATPVAASVHTAAAGRSLAPQRLFSAASASTAAVNAGPLSGSMIGARPSTSQAVSCRGAPAAVPAGSYTRSSSANRSRGSSGGGALVPDAGAQGAGGNGTSASLAALRATLHTDTVSAATRIKTVEPALLSQSSEFGSSGWRTPLIAQPTSTAQVGTRPSSSVARVLAPNGQPRKLPIAMAAALASTSPAAGYDASVAAGRTSAAALLPTTPQQSLLPRSGTRLSAYYSN